MSKRLLLHIVFGLLTAIFLFSKSEITSEFRMGALSYTKGYSDLHKLVPSATHAKADLIFAEASESVNDEWNAGEKDDAFLEFGDVLSILHTVHLHVFKLNGLPEVSHRSTILSLPRYILFASLIVYH